MDELRKQIGFSFRELEQDLWSLMLEEFGKGLEQVLKEERASCGLDMKVLSDRSLTG